MEPNPPSTWTELILLTQSVIQGLGLVYGPSGNVVALPASQVYAFKLPSDGFRLPASGGGSQVIAPCVQCCLGRMEDVADSIQTMEDTVVIYPVLVAILFGNNTSLQISNDLLYWRQQIYAAFEDFPTALETAVSEFVNDVSVWDCQITTQPVQDLMLWQKNNLDFSWLVLNYKTTRDRGRD